MLRPGGRKIALGGRSSGDSLPGKEVILLPSVPFKSRWRRITKVLMLCILALVLLLYSVKAL